MAPRSIAGIYRDARVELLEVPEGLAGSSETVRREAGERLMARSRQRINLGGSPHQTREENYDERIQELERRRSKPLC